MKSDFSGEYVLDRRASTLSSLGFQTRETASAVSVYIGDQMIDFHRPTLWQDPT
jgi:hypothetical protein